MEKLLTNLVSGKLSTYAAITLMFTYTFLLNRDFECSCEPQKFHCNLYLILPVFIIVLLILWTDESFQRVCRYLCSCAKCSKFRCSFFIHILKAALVGLLWVAFVLLEGDWYVCCKNDHSEQQTPLACKVKDNITEKERVIIAELRNWSRVIGGFTLFGIVLVASLIPLCRKCCERHSSCCNRRFLYEELILEEEDNVLKEIWRKLAKDQLTIEVEDKLRGEQWKECFDVAVGQINASNIPTIMAQQRLRARGADNQENQSPETSTNQENPSPRNSTNQENPSPGNSTSLELQHLVRAEQKGGKQRYQSFSSEKP